MADGGAGSVAGMDDGGVRELHELAFQRGEDFVEGAAPKVGAADTSREERVAGEKLRLAEGGVTAVGGQVERNAAGGVTGSVDDVG